MNVQNAIARRGNIANTDTTIDTTRTEIGTAIGIGIGIETGTGIIGIAMMKMMDTDTSAHDTRATMMRISHDIDIDIVTSDIRRHQMLKKISPFPTKRSHAAKTLSRDRSL